MVSAIAIEKGFEEFIQCKVGFDDFALQLFLFQAAENKIYKEYLQLINFNPKLVREINQVPFLPINFFKNHKIVTTDYDHEQIFRSSSTTGQIPSQHYIKSVKHYLVNTVRIFEQKMAEVKRNVVVGLLPSYLERSDSSLVGMVDYFIKISEDSLSGFHLYDFDKLITDLSSAKDQGKSVILFTVRYALLELAEQYQVDLSHVTIIETGGMKGKRGPVSNEELADIVKQKLQPASLISEYGMTELQSQAYSNQDFVFDLPDSMQVMITDLNDPFTQVREGSSGQLNVIDLANIYSCAFIATDDMGVKIGDSQFRVLGRLDHSEQRGCNLLVADVIT